MATLYVNNGGFRFPYIKWTETSIPDNLRFLQAQIDRFLHGHVISGTTLYVEKEGFRSPKALTRDNLEENMRFIEAQLDKFLHSHTKVDSVNGALDPQVDLTSVFPGPGESVSAGSYFWVDSSNRTVTQSTLNSHTGSNHIRVSVTGSSAFGVTVADPDISNTVNKPKTIALLAGETVTASVWARSNTVKDLGVEFIWYNSVESAFDETDVSLGNLSSSYQFFESAAIEAPAGTVEVGVMWRPAITDSAGEIYDFDTFGINASDAALFVRDEGFRFPYGWKTDGDLSMNRQFLETLISQFLHEHEVVA